MTNFKAISLLLTKKNEVDIQSIKDSTGLGNNSEAIRFSLTDTARRLKK